MVVLGNEFKVTGIDIVSLLVEVGWMECPTDTCK